MLDRVKNALRVKSDAFDDEIEGLIAAALADLRLVGIVFTSPPEGDSAETGDPVICDPLILRAVILYAKTHYGFISDKDRDQFRAAYEQLKCSLSLAGDYQNGRDNKTS